MSNQNRIALASRLENCSPCWLPEAGQCFNITFDSAERDQIAADLREIDRLQAMPTVAQQAMNDPLEDLVARFSKSLLAKLKLARANGRDGWEKDDWEADCQLGLLRHIEKGDPRDVAAYCAFMWHHGWITTQRPKDRPNDGVEAENGENFQDMAAHIWAAGASLEDADFITRMLLKKGHTLVQAEPWKRCPSTHCERRGECTSPRDCTVKQSSQVTEGQRQNPSDGAIYAAVSQRDATPEEITDLNQAINDALDAAALSSTTLGKGEA